MEDIWNEPEAPDVNQLQSKRMAPAIEMSHFAMRAAIESTIMTSLCSLQLGFQEPPPLQC